jgi:acyl carrier protein
MLRKKMSELLISELKELIIDGLHLEDVSPDDIDVNEPLFGEGLGLDSIDALEISVLLDRQYGVKITSGDDRNPEIFASLQALADFVATERTN